MKSCVEEKSQGREILCTLGVPSLKRQHQTSSDQLCLCKNCSVMVDLKGAPAVYFNFPLHPFAPASRIPPTLSASLTPPDLPPFPPAPTAPRTPLGTPTP